MGKIDIDEPTEIDKEVAMDEEKEDAPLIPTTKLGIKQSRKVLKKKYQESE